MTRALVGAGLRHRREGQWLSVRLAELPFLMNAPCWVFLAFFVRKERARGLPLTALTLVRSHWLDPKTVLLKGASPMAFRSPR